MATATMVHLIVYRLCECYGTGRATSHGLSAATGTSQQRTPRLRFAFFASGFLRASHAMSINEHGLEVSEPSLR